MATYNPIMFLLNRDETGVSTSTAVSDPAFSITKVMATAALVLTPVVTFIVNKATSVDFSNSQIVVLVLGVLGFLAITAAADVLARAVATTRAAPEAPKAEIREVVQNIIPIDPAWQMQRIVVGQDPKVRVVALRRANELTECLILDEETLVWVALSELAND